MKNFAGIQTRLMVPTYPNRGVTIIKGKGVYLYDQTGKKYLDLMSNIGVNILGHSNEYIINKVSTQLKKLTNLHCSLPNDTRSLLLQKLQYFLPNNLTHYFFSNSGTESIEAALKFAILATGKNKFIAAKNGYHGKTLGSLTLTTSSDKKYQKPFSNSLEKHTFVKFGDFNEIKHKINSSITAVILEPIQGEGGIIIPPKGYLKKVESICKNAGVLLILDEIQTGAGRTGRFLASNYEKIKPDILCLSKGIGGGMPFGITAVTNKVNKKIPKGIHTSTFGGNPLACSGCLATLEYLEKNNTIKNAKEMGNYFIKKLKSIKNKKIKEVRGKGLMIALELNSNSNPFLKGLQNNGIIAAPSSVNSVRFLPPLIITKKDIDLAIIIIKKVLNE